MARYADKCQILTKEPKSTAKRGREDILLQAYYSRHLKLINNDPLAGEKSIVLRSGEKAA
jgi:hypothetical protein